MYKVHIAGFWAREPKTLTQYSFYCVNTFLKCIGYKLQPLIAPYRTKIMFYQKIFLEENKFFGQQIVFSLKIIFCPQNVFSLKYYFWPMESDFWREENFQKNFLDIKYKIFTFQFLASKTFLLLFIWFASSRLFLFKKCLKKRKK